MMFLGTVFKYKTSFILELTKILIISKDRTFIFTGLTCLVLVKVNYYQNKLFQLLVERFPAFSCRTESRY